MLISASKIITESVSLYWNNWKEVLYYVFLFMIVSVGMVFFQKLLFPNTAIAIDGLASIGLPYLAYTLFRGVFIVIILWLSTGLIRVIAKLYKNQKQTGVVNELEQSAKIILQIIAVSILTSIAIGLGFFFFIIPGIIATVWFAFALYRVVLEEDGPIKAMKQSRKLVEGRWWQVLWRLFFPALILNFAIALINGMILFIIRLLTSNIWIINSAITFLGFILFPVTIIAVVILYIELKKTPAKKVSPHPEPEKAKEGDNIVASN